MGSPSSGSPWQKQMRLRRPEEFRRARSEGRSWAHPLFILWRAPNMLNYSRVGIAASRRVGHAVGRNRARRLLREAARQLYVHISAGWDIVLVARSGLLDAGEVQVGAALHSVMECAGLLAPIDATTLAEPDARGIV